MAKTKANGTITPVREEVQFSPELQAQIDAAKAHDAAVARAKRESFKTLHHYQENGKFLYEDIKNGALPLFDTSIADDKGNVSIEAEAIRSASTGRVFRGTSQLLAQGNLKFHKLQDKEILTYEQAGEKNIKKGQPHFTLTTFDAKTKTAHHYNYYPASAVIDQSKIVRPVKHRNTRFEKSIPKEEFQKHPDIIINAHGIGDPATYTGKYLAACSLGAKFATDAKTQKDIQDKLVRRFAPAMENAKPLVADIYKFGNEASAACKETLSAIFKERAQTQERKQEKKYDRTLAQDAMSYN